MLNAKHSGKPVECAALLNEILLAFRRVQSSGKWRCYCVHCASFESKLWIRKFKLECDNCAHIAVIGKQVKLYFGA